MSKVVLVTGSSKGLGSEIIKKYAKNGYNVVINYNKDKLYKTYLQLHINNIITLWPCITDYKKECKLNNIYSKYNSEIIF